MGAATSLLWPLPMAADAGDPRAFDRAQLVVVVAAGGGMTLAIAVFVVAGTIAFAIGRRRREISLTLASAREQASAPSSVTLLQRTTSGCPRWRAAGSRIASEKRA
jgi:hypothetical protein